ncbi:hypothetical protein [Streptomyces cadmiisoli]|uniref:hypothetical protein n=1 Tax=Streptomyces cadmiisoli TaxID=2184053 RepID=UPI0036476C2D
MCVTHGRRARLYGSPEARKKRGKGSIRVALYAAATAKTNECVILSGYQEAPRILHEGRYMLAARAVWIIAQGDPGDRLVLHRCNGGSGAHGCINIHHLYLGDHAQNMRDASKAGVWSGPNLANRGEGHGNAKLTEADVREIRSLSDEGMGRTALAERYSVSRAAIRAIATRRNWAWLPDEPEAVA